MKSRPSKQEQAFTVPRLLGAALVALVLAGGILQAGDILRGGAGNGGAAAKRNATTRSNAGGAEAAQASANAKDRLARTTQAIQSVRNMQQKAASSMRTVPDGLQSGGLKVLTGANARWDGADAPNQTGNLVNIKQNESQAVLHWETFNVGRNTTVKFDQSKGGKDASKWIAFNKIFDPSGKPSEILGSIRADGQVYLINQNGIIFGAGSQVNTRTLVASSLPINDNLIQRGLLNQEAGNIQFLFTALPSGTFTPQPSLAPGGRIGDVVVEPGAYISSPVNAEGYGGRVMLAAPNVRNEGVISTPAGQTILAAGLQVGVDSHSSSDASLRGLDVFVGATSHATLGQYAAEAVNTGLIESARGSVVMAGKRVLQQGIVESSTSVDVNGRIDLLANYNAVANPVYDATKPSLGPAFLFQSTGLVELGANSVMRILPEWDDPKTIARASLPLSSRLNIQAQTIHFGAGSMVLAPSAQVTLDAGEWIYQVSGSSPRSDFIFSSGQIYFDRDSLLDVSGTTDVFVPLAQSVLTIQLRGSELANSPLQRNSNLRAVKLTVDLRESGTFNGLDWVGTPLGDAKGFLNLIERNAAQLTMQGGDITMRAGGSVVVQNGAVIDASGGYANNEGGRVQTTRIRFGSYLIDISDATPDRIYDGIYEGKSTQTSSKWGVSKSYLGSLLPLGGYNQSSYIAGANAGSISISAPSMALDGTISGRTVVGPRQIRETAISSNLPKMGQLSLIFEAQDKNAPSRLGFPTISPTPPLITFLDDVTLASAGDFVVGQNDVGMTLSEERRRQVNISPLKLREEGIGQLVVRNSDGQITVGAGITLSLAAGGVLDLSGANIDVAGSILVPGGTINLTAYNYSPYLAKYLDAASGDQLPAASSTRGIITLASGESINAAGLVIDDRMTGPLSSLAAVTNIGGKVSLNAYTIQLEKDSTIDVSGGTVYGSEGSMAFGSAGSISLLAGQDPNLTGILGGHLDLGATLRGFSGILGGALAIKAPLIQIGGSSDRADTMVFQPEFFNEGGFAAFDLKGIGAVSATTGEALPGLLITAGTVINPIVKSGISVPYDSQVAGRVGFMAMEKPQGLRNPVSLTFGATGAVDNLTNLPIVRGDVVLSEGAVVRTDPLGKIAFDGETVSILGSVYAPAGTIQVSGSDSFPLVSPSPVALTTVYLGPQSILSATGTTLFLPDPYGRRIGQIYNGGRIEVSGNIVADAGALLDVSGTLAELDLTPAALGSAVVQAPSNSGVNAPLHSLRVQRTPLSSNGGAIILEGSEMLAVEATMLGRAGGPGAAGGSLSVSSGRYVADGEASTSADIDLIVQQNGSPFGGGLRGVGQALRGANGATLKGMGYFSVDQFTQGGFDSLELGGNISFNGPISISAPGALLIGSGGVIQADSTVSLTAAYARIGQEFPTPRLPDQQLFLFTQTNAGGTTTEYKPTPTSGAGQLNIAASLIDVGTLVLNNISKAGLTAMGGDIRGNGTFVMAGDLILTAGQIYPTTTAAFNIFAYDAPGRPGSITVQGSGYRPLPLSAGGSLNLMASIIHQGGTLRAPLGSISIGWDGLGDAPTNPLVPTSLVTPITSHLTLASGSVTSVSAVDPVTGLGMVIPYGLSPDGLSWVDPSGVDITLAGLPAKQVTVGAQNLQTEAGSVIDVSGGGDLYAYRWVSGLGGTTDILASNYSFAIVPGYAFNYAPYAPFNPSSTAALLQGDKGYTNGTLSVGDQITLAASSALPAGTYTLLPARYALMPGAVLITLSGGASYGSVNLEDGSVLAPGYISNAFTKTSAQPFLTFQLLTSSAVRDRAEYKDYFANAFLANAALVREQEPQRLPGDAGRVNLLARTGLVLNGQVLAKPSVGGRGSLIDIAAEGNIWITDGSVPAPAGSIVLNAATLSSFGAESLLIGGHRTGTGDSTVQVRTSNILLDNQGASFSAPEIILAANQSLALAEGASIISSGGLSSPAAELNLTGDGAMVRVSGDASASSLRKSFVGNTNVDLVIGDNVILRGGSITLDSTYDTDLSVSALLEGRTLNLNSGKISFLLDNPGTTSPSHGLVFTGEALQSLQSAGQVSFLSYSSLDFYGTGVLALGDSASFILRAGEIRGHHQQGGSVIVQAGDVLLDNSQGASATALGAMDGVLQFDVGTFRIGSNTVAVNGFSDLIINASGGIYGQGTGGLSAQGNLIATTPALTASAAAKQSLTAGGNLTIVSAGGTPVHASGLGASYTLSGGSVLVTSDIYLPSGLINISSTAGNVVLGGTFDVSGTSQQTFDVIRYTDAGGVSLTATGGDVVLLNSGSINLSAAEVGGNAGTLSVSAANGLFDIQGSLKAEAGTGGKSGSFVLDSLNLTNFDALNAALDTGSFHEGRAFRARTGDVVVNNAIRAHNFSLAADQGAITVFGTIDASGRTGGKITLSAHGDVVLENGSLLTVAAQDFNNAGKGGSVTIEAGTQWNGLAGPGFVDLKDGSTIDLRVASLVAGDVLTPGSSAFYGKFGGTLHLRSPRTAGNNDVQIRAFDADILGASSILVEGYKIYAPSGGVITTAVQNTIKNDATAFLGAAGTASAAYTALMNRLLAHDATLASALVLAPGVELINLNGDLTLGTTSSTATSDWNLASFRFGEKSAAGVLTMRASNNLVFYNALSDGFSGGTSLWLAPLMAYNPLLPANAQSWSYRLTAGADLTAANFQATQGTTGSLKLGKNYGNAVIGSPGSNLLTSTIVEPRFQVIRTGSGDIDINAAGDVLLLNQFATIYTAGTAVPNAANLFGTGDFSVPILDSRLNTINTILGRQQQLYIAQYSMAGGNVNISAGHNIARMTQATVNGATTLVDDSSRQMPTNWLYRRGYVDPVTGEYGLTGAASGSVTLVDPSASTTWWVDFSNFFEGVGALGGGNVSLVAGNDVRNVDAVAPTNARAASGRPDPTKVVELGGGDVTVKAGNDISGGVYYVERGSGALSAGGDITTNSTRSPSLGIVGNLNNPTVLDSSTWLGTTLFIGRGGFDVTAGGDLLLGPVANLSLIPQGIGNKFWYKTYFSTYGSDSYVNAMSLGGDVTHRLATTLPDQIFPMPALQAWMQTQDLFSTQLSNLNSVASNYQPWLRLSETDLKPFATVLGLMTPVFRSTALSGSINIVGDLTLYPSSKGTLELVAANSVSGLFPTGLSNTAVAGASTHVWTAATINVSDANPTSLPGMLSPIAYFSRLSKNAAGLSTAVAASQTASDFSLLTSFFQESGSYTGVNGVVQTKQSLHASGLLHADDAEPLRIYTGLGDISGLTLFSPKRAQVFAGNDISDITFYIQNVSEDDFSLVSAARDIIPYDANTLARVSLSSPGNILSSDQSVLAGDIQISGPGLLEVAAGRHIDLGTGPNNPDGTGVGITSIGNARNPFLPFGGASIIVSAGLSSVSINQEAFLDEFLDSQYVSELLDGRSIESLTEADLAQIPMQLLFLILRDTGREFLQTGSYEKGYAAIESFFGPSRGIGDINTRSRDIRTKSGGNISILTPSGSLVLAESILANPQTPPGIVTEYGGDISILTNGDVRIGQARIFTLRGGDIMIWSSEGDIAAGAASKTVATAPPTRVLVDPQSATVETDLAGLATGGGIGVLSTVEGVDAGDVDLIAPRGAVDAGDAGIRASGNLNIAANEVLNADNITVQGNVGGVPPAAPPAAAAPPGMTAASNATGAASSAASQVANQSRSQDAGDELPSLFSAEVLGYGGGEDDEDDENRKPGEGRIEEARKEDSLKEG